MKIKKSQKNASQLIPPQRRVKYIGAIKNVLSRSTFYISILNFFMIIATSYVVVIQKYFPLPFWCFLLVLILLVIGIMVFDYIIMLPSEISFMNWQTYEHNNPLREDLENLREELEKLDKKVNQILSRMNKK